jgi:hypothetical protein
MRPGCARARAQGRLFSLRILSGIGARYASGEHGATLANGTSQYGLGGDLAVLFCAESIVYDALYAYCRGMVEGG